MESIFWLDSIWRRYSIFCVLEHFEADFTRQNDHFKECLAAATKLHFFGNFFSEASLNIKKINLKEGPNFFLTLYLLLNRAIGASLHQTKPNRILFHICEQPLVSWDSCRVLSQFSWFSWFEWPIRDRNQPTRGCLTSSPSHIQLVLSLTYTFPGKSVDGYPL